MPSAVNLRFLAFWQPLSNLYLGGTLNANGHAVSADLMYVFDSFAINNRGRISASSLDISSPTFNPVASDRVTYEIRLEAGNTTLPAGFDVPAI